MARMNVTVPRPPKRTYEGGQAIPITPLQELRRAVLTSMLWEKTFYESAQGHGDRVAALVAQCKPEDVAALAVEARDKMYLRHVPLFLVRQLAKTKGNGVLVADTLERVIQRPDEMGEFLAMYWDGQTTGTKKRPAPLSAGVKRGLARAFRKFGAYALAKYNRETGVRLRDVLRLVHADPGGDGVAVVKTFAWTADGKEMQAHRVRRHAEGKGQLWGQVIDGTLAAPDTWEVALSAGKDKKETFERLLIEGKLGALAFLRNLRNMIEAGVDAALVRARFAGALDKVLPFRYLAAARHAPSYASDINDAMLRAVVDEPRLAGRTAVLVDVSGSMDAELSAKSEMKRFDAAAGVAVLVREIADNCRVFAFSTSVKEVASWRGIPLAHGIIDAMPHGGTNLGAAVRQVASEGQYDRMIVITDEQAHDRVDAPVGIPACYMINVATYENAVGFGPWVRINGWSERVLDFVRAVESKD